MPTALRMDSWWGMPHAVVRRVRAVFSQFACSSNIRQQTLFKVCWNGESHRLNIGAPNTEKHLITIVRTTKGVHLSTGTSALHHKSFNTECAKVYTKTFFPKTLKLHHCRWRSWHCSTSIGLGTTDRMKIRGMMRTWMARTAPKMECTACHTG